MSAQDTRLVIRMSQDLRSWIRSEAAILEMDESTFARVTLIERRLWMASNAPPMLLAPKRQNIASVPIISDEPDISTEPIDVDALVAGTLADAEEQGLTEPPPEPERPTGGVRAIRRPAVPFSATNQPRHLVER